jgi:flagellin
MGFRINTNIAAMNSHTNAVMNNRSLDSSLEKLSSGLRINKAADDSSGMAIADSLRSQASALGQSIANANDAIGIIQIADKAMDEQLKILDTIKTKATQAAQDGQSLESREAIQKDIARLLENMNNIAFQTSYNGQSLLSGAFTNKEFQIGAYSNETVKASIGATNIDKIGHVRYERATLTASITADYSFSMSINDVKLENVTMGYDAGEGVGALAAVINKNSELTGVRATYDVNLLITGALSGDVTDLSINGVTIGSISGVQGSDADGRLINAINSVKTQTGVEAYTNSEGQLNLRSVDGRGIVISSTAGAVATQDYAGTLTLIQLDARDIIVSGSDTLTGGESTVLNLGDSLNKTVSGAAWAIGASGPVSTAEVGVGVTSFEGAQLMINLAEAATVTLDTIRSDLGSAQNQLVSTINNISVTQVNVKAAESQIRDVDFAAESANFSKHNILAQSGSYAMSQANAVQQNVLRLLQ